MSTYNGTTHRPAAGHHELGRDRVHRQLLVTSDPTDLHHYARQADPRQTRRYARAGGALDRNPTYIVATYVAGATGAR